MGLVLRFDRTAQRLQIGWVWLSLDGVGRPSLIAFWDNKEMTLNLLWGTRQKKEMYNILNWQRQPVCNTTTQNRRELMDMFGRQTHKNTHTCTSTYIHTAGGYLVGIFWFKLLSRLDPQGLHAEGWIPINDTAHHICRISSQSCRLCYIMVQFLLSD